MTDLEMTKLCAEAMGIKLSDSLHNGRCREFKMGGPIYWPLEIDAQAMALVKKFNIWITGADNREDGCWSALIQPCGIEDECLSSDLNRAIVECVAKMRKP